MATLRIAHDEYRDGGLPPICIVCGEPADEFMPVSHRFSRVPAWIFLFILLGFVGVVIIFILDTAFRNSRKIETPLCEEHRGYWTLREWVYPAVLLAFIGLFISCATLATFNARTELYFAVSGAILVFLIVVAVFHYRSIRPIFISDSHLILVNVNPNFRNAVHRIREAARDELEEFRDWKRKQGRWDLPRNR